MFHVFSATSLSLYLRTVNLQDANLQQGHLEEVKRVQFVPHDELCQKKNFIALNLDTNLNIFKVQILVADSEVSALKIRSRFIFWKRVSNSESLENWCSDVPLTSAQTDNPGLRRRASAPLENCCLNMFHVFTLLLRKFASHSPHIEKWNPYDDVTKCWT